MRGEPPEPILNAGNDDFNISLNGQPCKFQPCPGFYKLPTAVDGIRQESQSLESKMPPICQKLHSSLYISYPSQFQRTQHILQNKSQVANPIFWIF